MTKKISSGSSISKRSIKKSKSSKISKKTTATVKKQTPEIYDVPKRRPDGISVRDTPDSGSPAERKRLQKGDRASAAYHSMSGDYKRVFGIIVGFCQNDVLIHNGKGSFYFVDGKNVFR